MTIKIGERTLATRRTASLDDDLIAATGCSAAEHAAMLAGGGTAFQVARALAPMLAKPDGMSVADLSAMIAEGDVVDVRRQVVALLTPAPGATTDDEEVAHGASA